VLSRMNSSPTDRPLPGWLAILFLTLCGFAGALQADENASPQEGSIKPQDAVKKPAAEDRSSRATARAKGDLTFDDLKFDIEKGAPFERSMLTQEIEGLNKKTIRIRGYILPASVFKQTGIDEFVLVRDNMECCFGPGAAIYDCIMIKMEKGKTADFTTRPVAVKGKFEVEELKFPDGTHYAIYKLTATEAK
jgi:hypothetical protein